MERLKAILKDLQARGIPLVYFRDPKTQEPSVTFTMMVASFVLCVAAVIGKVADSKLLGGLSFDNCLQLLMATGAGYLGRKFMSGDKSLE